MGTEPTSRGSPSGPASSFRKVWGPEGYGMRTLGVGTPGLEGVEAWKGRAFPLKTTGWPADLQASDGEEAPGTHQHVSGAAQVSSGETLLASGKAGEEGSDGSSPSPVCLLRGAYGLADTETEVGKG